MQIVRIYTKFTITGRFFEVLIGARPEPIWQLLSKVGILYTLEPIFTIIFVINMNGIWEKVMSSLRAQIFQRVLIQKVFSGDIWWLKLLWSKFMLAFSNNFFNGKFYASHRHIQIVNLVMISDEFVCHQQIVLVPFILVLWHVCMLSCHT